MTMTAFDKNIRSMVQKRHTDLTEFGQFRHDFWAYYVDLHPHDGIRPGYAGYSPDYHVEGMGLKIRRYLTRKYVALWITTERDLLESVSELVEPYLPALAKELGTTSKELYNGDPGHLPRHGYMQLLVDTNDRDNWAEASDWLHEHLKIYRRVLSKPPAD